MKRHCILYHTNFGRNDGPPLYYFHNLKKLPDTEVVHLVPDGDISQFGKFDYYWWIDYGEDGLPVDHEWTIPQDGGKTIYVCSDAHIDENGRDYRFNQAKKFDYAFFNQKRALEESGIKSAHFMPHAAEPDAYHPFEIVKKYDVAFIGHVQTQPNYNGFTRVEALDRLFKEFPNFYFGTRNPQKPEANMFEDAARNFSQSKIVFNVSIGDDLNMRLFEALATRSFLLTNWLPTLEDLFEDGKHLVTYKTLDEMVEKAKYYLEHEEEREAIAEAGYQEFINGHTYMHRINKILNIVEG